MAVRKAAIWSVGSQWFVFAFNFAVSVYLARYLLPPSAFGTFSVGFAAAGIISNLQDFGLSRYVVRADELTDEVLDACTTITLIVGVAIFAAIAGLSVPMAWYYANSHLIPIMLLISAAFLFLPFNTVPIALLQREVDFRTLSFINMAAAAANATVSTMFALWGYGPISLAAGFLGQQVARATMAQLLGPRRVRFKLSLRGARPIVSFGSGTTVLAVSGAIGTRSPDLIIGNVLGMHAVGLFGRAAGMVDGLRALLDGGLSSVFFSHFAQLLRERRTLAQPYLDLISCYTSVMWPAMLLLSMLATPVVTMIYGTGWGDAARALRWVALSELMFFALPLHTEVPLISGHLRELLVRNLLDTIVALVCLVCLVRFGLEAAAAARLIYAFIWYAIYIGMMQRIVGFSKRALVRVYAKSALSTLAACLPAMILVGQGDLLSFRALAAAVIGGSLWLVALAMLDHPAWRELRRGATNFRRPASFPAQN
jgi:O-antigen/teichoic acid export membrane protein